MRICYSSPFSFYLRPFNMVFCRCLPLGAFDESLLSVWERQRRVQQSLCHQTAAQLQVCLTEIVHLIFQKTSSNLFSYLLLISRSHPAILKIPNELFYDGELQCHANEMLRNSYCRWEHLKRMVMTDNRHWLHIRLWETGWHFVSFYMS